MSVNINWNSLEQESLISWSKKLLNDALNSGKRPSILASDIEIKDLNFGHNSPIVEILEIGDLDSDKFRGIFKIKYTGDSYINLATKIQANPMNIFYNNLVQKYSDFILPDLSLVNQNFTIPINLKLSKIMLSGIIIIVFNKSKGLTLVFKNDPLENINVSSTFDAIPTIRNFLQTQIENQIRDLFREILPNVLYKVSQKWTNNIHSQLLSNNNNNSNSNSNKAEKEKVVLFSDINPDGPDLSPANLLRLSTLSASRQSLSLSAPVIKDFIQRSMVEKYLNDNLLTNNQNTFLLMSKLSKDFNTLPFNNKYSNSLPIELFTAESDSGKDYNSIEKSVIDVSKYQSMSYNNKHQTNNKKVKKPKRRVIKLGGKKSAAAKDDQKINEEQQFKSNVSTITATSSKTATTRSSPSRSIPAVEYPESIGDSSTLVDEEGDDNELSLSNLSIDTSSNQQLRNKRALSSSSASVEYLRSLYQEQNKEKKAAAAAAATTTTSENTTKPAISRVSTADRRPNLITQLSSPSSPSPSTERNHEFDNPLKNKLMLSLSLGLNNSAIITNNYKKKQQQQEKKQKAKEKSIKKEQKTDVKDGRSSPILLKLNLNEKLRKENDTQANYEPSSYYKKFSNFNDESRLSSVDFFTKNSRFNDVPPPYVP